MVLSSFIITESSFLIIEYRVS